MRKRIWFDDGYESVFKIAYPIMREYGLTGIVCVITSRVGKFGVGKIRRKLMSIKQLKTLINEGWEIASHTVSHPVMKALTKKQFLTEILVSKQWIIKNLGVTPIIFVPSGYSIRKDQIRLALKYYSVVRVRSNSDLIFHGTKNKDWFIKKLRESGLIDNKID